ncbi:MAG: cytochrome c [Limnochordales bacterium]
MSEGRKRLHPAAAILVVLGVGLAVVGLLVFGPLSGRDGPGPAPGPGQAPGPGASPGPTGGGAPRSEMSALAQRGRELFNIRGCTTCHTVDGSPGIGPSLLGVWGSERRLADGTVVVADAAYVRESIVDPMAKIVEGFLPSMTSYAWLGEEDIEALTAYIEWLGD